MRRDGVHRNGSSVRSSEVASERENLAKMPGTKWLYFFMSITALAGLIIVMGALLEQRQWTKVSLYVGSTSVLVAALFAGALRTDYGHLVLAALFCFEFFIEEGIDGATVLESSGMGHYISNIPLFASFIGFMNEDKNRSRTIVAMVPENKVNDIIQGIERITGDLDKKEGAMVFTVDASFHKGSMRML